MVFLFNWHYLCSLFQSLLDSDKSQRRKVNCYYFNFTDLLSGKTEDKPVSSFLQRRNNTPPTSVGIKPSRSQEVLSEQEPPSPDEAEKLNGETKLTPQKRKQDQFVAEIHDRAEVRKGCCAFLVLLLFLCALF